MSLFSAIEKVYVAVTTIPKFLSVEPNEIQPNDRPAN
jgi:hypothetical protein